MRPVIFGCKGLELSAEEAALYSEADPFGFILFKWNCDTPDQVRRLVGEMRDAVGRAAPIFIDQEGGRVRRLHPPHWWAAPAAAVFGDLFTRDAEAGRRAAWLNARLMAEDLFTLGIDVDCVPCLDLRHADTHAAIGDRAFSGDPEIVIELARAQIDGLAAGGVSAVIKHLPGHGRARVDSHEELPRIEESRAVLSATDFQPFAAFGDLTMGMTGHLLLREIDPTMPATLSQTVITEVIRGEIGFDGLLLSDDLSMKALRGGLGERAAGALAAGCDIALHCNGDLAEMRDIAERIDGPSADTTLRIARVDASRRKIAGERQAVACEDARAELQCLLD